MLTAVASMYSLYEAGNIRYEHVVVRTSKLPPHTPKLRIVQISDVHVGLLTDARRLGRIATLIQEAHPDILVSTGDLVDGKLNRHDSISGDDPPAALLAAVDAPGGKFAVIGNHEVYAGLPQATAFTERAGFSLLRDRSERLSSGITISGIDDTSERSGRHDESAVTARIPRNSFHILLKHRPEITPGSDGTFDLQLSGHVHGGQIFPFNLLVRAVHRIPCGTSVTPAGSRIHVSRGSGTWGPPMRLFAPPEVTIIDIESGF